MKGTLILALTVVIAAFALTACGGSEKAVQPQKAGLEEVFYPDWWDIQDNPDNLNCFGMSTKASQNLSFDDARAQATLEASQFVDQRVKGMVKSYEEENGVENSQVTSQALRVVKIVTDATFSGAQVTKRQQFKTADGKFTTYVRVTIPKSTINKNLRDAIKNEEALFNAFKASQAFKELDQEVEGGK
jgi:hypothetical protein